MGLVVYLSVVVTLNCYTLMTIRVRLHVRVTVENFRPVTLSSARNKNTVGIQFGTVLGT